MPSISSRYYVIAPFSACATPSRVRRCILRARTYASLRIPFSLDEFLFRRRLKKKKGGRRESGSGNEIEHGWNTGIFIEFLSFQRLAMVGSDGFDGFVTMIQRHVRFGSNGVLWKRRVNEWNWIDWQMYIYICMCTRLL